MKKVAESIGKLKTFLQEVKVELMKCSWPSRKELFDSSVVVIVSILLLGGCIALFDLLNTAFIRLVIH